MKAPADRASIVTLGFATAVAMWGVGYAGSLPFIQAPAWLLIALLVGCLFGGGWLTGRWTSTGLAGGLKVGAVAYTVDLLVLGAVLGKMAREEPGAALGSAVAILCATMAITGAGALLGARREGEPPPREWSSVLACVAAAATLLLIMVGGLVTTLEAGMAVPDWPSTYGSNMFLYPLEKMTGGVYYEHAHRLFGSLVGLTTVVLGIVVWVRERRRWVKVTAQVAVLLVVAQGVMGGLRVTEIAIGLAVVHGITAQVFLSLILAIAAVTSGVWKSEVESQEHAQAESDHSLGLWVIGLVLVQLALGALVRHLPDFDVTWHIVMAVIVVIVTIAAGTRSWGIYPELPVLPRVGVALVVLICLQLLLGIAALGAVAAGGEEMHPAEVPIATAHQTTGALVLAAAVQLRVWHARLTRPAPKSLESAPEAA